MRKRENLLPAAIAASAIGPGIVTGRETAGFFSQTAESAWLGVACAGAVFALLTAGLIYMKACTGAQSLSQMTKRLPVRAGGLALRWFHGLLMAFEAFLMLATAWEIGALTLPFHGGGAAGAGMALLITLGMTALPIEARMRICAGNFMLILAFEAALAAFGRLPAAAEQYVEAELKLSGMNAAAALLGGIHASLSVCVAANVVLRFTPVSARPLRTGICCGAFYAACLAVGNLAICRQPGFVAALRLPLTALAAGWGSAGFCLVTLLSFFASVIVLHAALLTFCDVKL